MDRPHRPEVLIVQAEMKQYRVPFFTRLYDRLRAAGVHLTVAYSSPPDSGAQKDNADLPEEVGTKVPAWWFARRRLLYQPLAAEMRKADLVVLEQANKHLLNVPALLASRLGLKKVAFWGHGRNRQAKSAGLGERVKSKTVGWVDWWFAYTRGVAEYLVEKGFPAARITTVQNSIDLREFRSLVSAVETAEVAAARADLGIAEAAPVGLYCGALYADKRLDLLLEAAALVRAEIPDFHLVVVGGGPEAEKIRAAGAGQPWIHYLGPLFGRRKALYFRVATLLLIPGSVGLAILDAFAAGLPLLTTRMPLHGPEIDYLENEVNGLMLEPDARTYANGIVRLLTDAARLEALKQGAARSAEAYSIERMVENFASGIEACLGLGARSAAPV